MKNLFLSAILIAFTVVSCNQKTEKTENNEHKEKTTELYACPMHPEVQGEKDEICPKCNMKLTEPVKKK